MEAVHGDSGVGSERKERCRSEVHVPAIAAKNVPGRCQHDILQNDISGEEIIIVAERERGGKDGSGDEKTDDQKQIRAHCQRPSKPAGRTARVRRRNPKETAGAQDGP